MNGTSWGEGERLVAGRDQREGKSSYLIGKEVERKVGYVSASDVI